MLTPLVASENDRSRTEVDGGARLVVRDRARSFEAAVRVVEAIRTEEAQALGPEWYPIRAEIQKRTEGAGCRVIVVFQRAGTRPRFGSHAARAAARAARGQGPGKYPPPGSTH